MYTRVLLFLLAAGAPAFCGAQPPTVKLLPVPRTSPTSGQEMFTTYCAACHGKEGKGDGPAATAMKKMPTDLTVIAARNNGKFPDLQVLHAISGDQTIAAHGSNDMPVWARFSDR